MNDTLFAPVIAATASPTAATLRPYQVEAVELIGDELVRVRATLLVMATGLGKTQVFVECVDRYSKKRAMVIAHRDELIEQAHNRIFKNTAHWSHIEKAASYAPSKGHDDIVIASVQTLIAAMGDGRRFERFDPNDFDLVVIDEAHHAVSASYLKVIEHFRKNPACKLLGVTATPDRLDKEALGQVFDSTAFEYGILPGIVDGYLVRVLQRSVEVDGLDYSKCRKLGDDFNQGDLAKCVVVPDVVQQFADAIERECGDRKTLVFAVDCDHAGLLCSALETLRPGQARVVTGETPLHIRRELFSDYGAGKFQYLCNVGVATEGYDEPGVSAVAMARGTQSRALYSQCIGRGTRVLPGLIEGVATAAERCAAIKASAKPDVLVVDFCGNAGKHTLITPRDILGGEISDEARELATREAKDKEGAVDTIADLERSEEELAERKRTRRAAAVAVHKALYFSHDIDPFDVLAVVPQREPGHLRGRKVTEKMAQFLGNYQIDTSRLSFAHAGQLITEIKRRDLITPKQAKHVLRCKLDPASVSKSQATKLIAALVRNSWHPFAPHVARKIMAD